MRRFVAEARAFPQAVWTNMQDPDVMVTIIPVALIFVPVMLIAVALNR